MKKERNKKPSHFIVNLEIYPFDLIVFIGSSNEYILKTLKELGVSEDDRNIKGATIDSETVSGRSVIFDTNQSMIWLKRSPRYSKDLAVLSHEIFHATSNIMRTVGIPLKESSEEAWAYLIGYLTNKILDNNY